MKKKQQNYGSSLSFIKGSSILMTLPWKEMLCQQKKWNVPGIFNKLQSSNPCHLPIIVIKTHGFSACNSYNIIIHTSSPITPKNTVFTNSWSSFKNALSLSLHSMIPVIFNQKDNQVQLNILIVNKEYHIQ